MCIMLGCSNTSEAASVHAWLYAIKVPAFVVCLREAQAGSQEYLAEMQDHWLDINASPVVKKDEIERLITKEISSQNLALKRPWKEYLQMGQVS